MLSMRTQSSALKQPIVTNIEILSLIAQREALESLKARMERLAESVRSIENGIIAKIEDGGHIDSEHGLQIKEIARRYPSWKNHFAALAGAEAADRVLAEMAPTITKSLVIKQRGCHV